MDKTACWWKEKKGEPWKAGWLHAWSTDNESSEISMPIPVGIVEDNATQRIKSVYCEMISLAAIPPTT